MLDQLIYTRCSPHRDLKNKGQVVRGDGFGVFSMSSELFSNKRLSNYDFLQARLAIQNGAKETSPVGLFNSYEYSMVAPGVYALSYEVARPHCKVPRANGQGHRTGTYIKQSFVGDIEGYPAEWFGSTAWDAHQKSENEYYLDNDPNATPALLPQVSSTPSNGYINTSVIKKFVADGRANAVKAGIWFLLQEFRKPEGERKVLLIRDTPDNVELWIAAIEYGFSASMAQKITFTTNRSKLGTQADSILFYYTDDTGRFYPMMNRSIPQTRHPYCMIVGYHPKDNFCTALKQMATSNFVIIDGTTKSISFQPDDSIRKPYYSAVVQYDADIQDFCNVILPSLPFQDLTGKLPELFDAYKYLLDSNHKSDKWGYSDTIYCLNILLQFGAPNNLALNNYLIDECLNVYQRFAREDETQGFSLLKYMWNLAKAVGRVRDITGCLADIISYKLCNLTTRNNDISGTWQALKAARMITVLQPALRDLFNDTELPDLAKQIKKCDASSVETVLDMFFQMLNSERIGISSIAESNEKYSFVCLSIVALLNDSFRLTELLKILNAAPDLFNGISLSVAEYLDKYEPSKSAAWWDTIMDVCGGSVLELCRKLCSSKSANIEMVEQLLSNRLERTRRFDNDLGRAFAESIKVLGKKPDTGNRLFRTWIKISTPSEFIEIIHAVKECALSVRIEEGLFYLIDESLPYDATRGITPMIYREVSQWAISLNKTSRSASFYEFKRAFKKERKVERAVNLAYSFAEMKFSVDEKFLSSNYFADLAAIGAEFCDADLHIALLCLFQSIDDTTMNHYVDDYVTKILGGTKSRYFVDQLVSLCEATMYKFKVPGRTAAFVNDIQRMLDASLVKQLVDYYKPALADQVSKYTDCEQSVRAKLITLLKDIDEKTAPKRFERFFNNLFGKR